MKNKDSIIFIFIFLYIIYWEALAYENFWLFLDRVGSQIENFEIFYIYIMYFITILMLITIIHIQYVLYNICSFIIKTIFSFHLTRKLLK